MKKVKLRRFPGWLEVGGKNYAIEKDITHKNSLSFKPVASNLLQDTDKTLAAIRKELTDRVEILTNGKNLFVSNDDTKTIKKQADKRLKRLEELEVKTASLHSSADKQEE